MVCRTKIKFSGSKDKARIAANRVPGALYVAGTIYGSDKEPFIFCGSPKYDVLKVFYGVLNELHRMDGVEPVQAIHTLKTKTNGG